MARPLYAAGLLFAVIATTCGLPRINDQEVATGVGNGLENVAASVLRAKFSAQENVVFAPFGYATILAILGEGARGETQREIRQFLRAPEDNAQRRAVFRSLLQLYGGEEPESVPQFKTWFYVYENNSANQEFVQTLRDDYLVEVKTIQRNFYDFDEPTAAEPEAVAADAPVQVTDDAPEKVVLPEPDPAVESEAKLEAETMFDEVDLEEKSVAVPQDVEAILKQKECSRFDEEVDDQQYVEVAAALKEGGVVAVAPEDNETVQQVEKQEEQKKIGKIVENEETLKQLDEEMGVLAVANKHPVTKKFQATARSLEARTDDDMSSALSGNSLTGRKEGTTKDESKMLLFNGLYFRGKWKTPFQRLRSVEETGNLFYFGGAEQPQEVAMMRSRGDFRTALSESLKARIIELPYENERYAMMVVMPVERDNGLRNLVDRLDYATIKQLSADLKLRTVELSLPKFDVETTSTVHKEFAEMGLSTLFSEAADFSGITEQQLRVDELVQHVSVRVDEGASTENSISATDVVARSGKSETEAETRQSQAASDESEETFVVNQPFLFFVRDSINDVTLVAGVINRPKGPQLFADLISEERSKGAAAQAGDAARQ